MTNNTTTVITAPIDSSWSDRAKAVAAPLALVAWTLFVWVGRVRNIIIDDDLDGISQLWRLALALSFITIAVGLMAALVPFVCWGRARSYGLARRAAAGLAWFGIIVWPIRAMTILVDSYDPGFKIVHTILAVVSVGLGAMVLRWVAATR